MVLCPTAEHNLKETTKALQHTIHVERHSAEQWRQELLALKSQSPQISKHVAAGSSSPSADKPDLQLAQSSRSPATGRVSPARPDPASLAPASQLAKHSQATSPVSNSTSSSSLRIATARAGVQDGDAERPGDEVEMQIRLGVDARQAGVEGSTQRAAFKIKLTQDLHRASGLPTKCFHLERFEPAPPREVGAGDEGGLGGGGLEVRVLVQAEDCDKKMPATVPARNPCDVAAGTINLLLLWLFFANPLAGGLTPCPFWVILLLRIR